MRIAVLGAALFVGLVIAFLAVAVQPRTVFADRVGTLPVGSPAGLVTLTAALGDNRQQLTVIDPELRVMSVYHIDASGEITLKCVRNIHWDLQMMEFNGASPLPREVRSLVQQK